MQSVQLFSESTTSSFGGVDVIVEQQNPQERKLLKIKGPFMVAETRNGNGRLYRKAVLDAAVADYNRDYVSQGRALGELGHPDRFEPVFQDSCIKIDEIKASDADPNIFLGCATVLQSDPARGIKGTAPGDTLASMLQYGVKVGVSSRALGQMNEDKIIDKYLKLCSCDVVYNPSAPGAYVDGILESRQFLLDAHGQVFEKAYKKLDEDLIVLPKKFKTEHLLKAFNTFISDISQHQ